MEQHRDEHIECADCGAAFVFSADEAAVFAERGLTAPKRCKDCRRARKERAGGAGQNGRRLGHQGNGHDGGYANGGYTNGHRSQGARYGSSSGRYTGDVNEYRSPMGEGFSVASYGSSPRYGSYQAASEYRSPMQDNGFGWRAPSFARAGARMDAPAARAPFRGDGAGPRTRTVRSDAPDFRPRDRQAPRPRNDAPRGPRPADAQFSDARPAHEDGVNGTNGARPPFAARRRPQAEMFSITCDSCGSKAEVPFKPAEGREVFCPTCYRARRPAQ